MDEYKRVINEHLLLLADVERLLATHGNVGRKLRRFIESRHGAVHAPLTRLRPEARESAYMCSLIARYAEFLCDIFSEDPLLANRVTLYRRTDTRDIDLQLSVPLDCTGMSVKQLHETLQSMQHFLQQVPRNYDQLWRALERFCDHFDLPIIPGGLAEEMMERLLSGDIDQAEADTLPVVLVMQAQALDPECIRPERMAAAKQPLAFA